MQVIRIKTDEVLEITVLIYHQILKPYLEQMFGDH